MFYKLSHNSFSVNLVSLIQSDDHYFRKTCIFTKNILFITLPHSGTVSQMCRQATHTTQASMWDINVIGFYSTSCMKVCKRIFWYSFSVVKCPPFILVIKSFPHFCSPLRLLRKTQCSSRIQGTRGWVIGTEMIILWSVEVLL